MKRPVQAIYVSQQLGHLDPTIIYIEKQKLTININNMELTQVQTKAVKKFLCAIIYHNMVKEKTNPTRWWWGTKKCAFVNQN